MPSHIGISVTTCWIGFVGYIKSQTEAKGFSAVPQKIEIEYSNPNEVEKILSLMKSKKPYLNPELDLTGLSELANINPKATSRLINHDLKTNFYEFINRYRVEEFKFRVQGKDSDKFSLW